MRSNSLKRKRDDEEEDLPPWEESSKVSERISTAKQYLRPEMEVLITSTCAYSKVDWSNQLFFQGG